jgi:hypothetical protein
MIWFQEEFDSLPDYCEMKLFLKMSDFDKGNKLFVYALSHCYDFNMSMKKCFIHQDFKVAVNLKSNFKRIAQKVSETKLKDGKSNPFKITDMLRATVFVNK